MQTYFHIATGHNPYDNLALEDLLLQNAPSDAVILYLWQNDNTVVIGRNQNAWRECRLEAFSAEGGYLARRSSGGGAVYHDLGNLNFSFIAPLSLYDVAKQTALICQAVSSFGLDAQTSGRNDILCRGRKFSGNAYHKTKHAALQHGTILLFSDLSRLARYLAPSPEKLLSKGLASVRGRVMNLCEENAELTVLAMQRALLDAFGQLYACKPTPLPAQLIEQDALALQRAHYASEAWRLGVQSRFDLRLQRRFPFGDLELLLQVENGYIQAAQVFSDAMDADWVERLASALHGCRYQSDALAACTPRGLACAEVQAYFRSLRG